MARTPTKGQRNPTALRQLVNVGPDMEATLRLIGVHHPDDLKGRDPYRMYADLTRVSGAPHDPCVLDVFISVVRFMDGGPPTPWWHFTAERKQELARRA
jgi:hypothetical protein